MLSRRTLRFHRVVLVALVFVSLGCGTGYPIARDAREAVRVAVDDDCELWLFGRQLATAQNGLARDLPAGAMGATLVERTAADRVREGVCLKHVGRPLTVPQPLSMGIPAQLPRFVAKGSSARGRFCDDEGVASKLKHSDGSEESYGVCMWNGFFHAARPFSFQIVAGSGVTDIKQLMQALRVFRNGELVYQWNSARSEPETELSIPGGALVASGSIFARSLPPHLAAFDLRILPAGAEVDEKVLQATVADDRTRNRERWQTLGFALLASASSELSPELRAALACFSAQLRDLEAQVRRLVDADSQSEPLPESCQAVPLGGAPELPLTERLKRLSGSADAAFAAELVRTKEALGSLEQGGATAPLSAALTRVKASLSEKLTALAKDSGTPVATLEQKLGNLDALIESARLAPQRARDLADKLRSEAVSLARDPERQARVAEGLIRAFENQPEIFDARIDNPTALVEERVLRMQYGDAFQGFLFSPWFGVPFRLTEMAGADLEASIAIPMLDVVGARYQIGRTRVGDVRAGLGLSAFLDKDLAHERSRAANEDGDETKKVFNYAAHVSVGFGTIKAALGLVMNNRESFEGRFQNRLRLIVGADLLKLITGRNVELL